MCNSKIRFLFSLYIVLSIFTFKLLANDKVGMLSNWGEKCGIAEYSKEIAQAMRKKGIMLYEYKFVDGYDFIIEKALEDDIQIINIQFIEMFISNKAEFLTMLSTLRNLGIRIVMTVHEESQKINEYATFCDKFLFHRKPQIYNGTNVSIIPFSVPVFDPKNLKRHIVREKYNFNNNDYIIATTGFLFPEKKLSHILQLMVPIIKKHKYIKLQFLNAINPLFYPICQHEANAINSIIKKYNLSNQVIFIDRFLTSTELRERLWLSDIGFTWCNVDYINKSISATEKEFIASRLPLVIPQHHHFDLDKGVIKARNDIKVFIKTIFNTLMDQQKLKILKKDIEQMYLIRNSDNNIGNYIKFLFNN